MKKIMVFILITVCIFSIVGCTSVNDNDQNKYTATITGIVKSTSEKSIMIENEYGRYDVTLNVKKQNSTTHFVVGDEVTVYYDGFILESYPMQITQVYEIVLKTPVKISRN